MKLRISCPFRLPVQRLRGNNKIITARTMSLHPAVSFGSAIAGGTLMGVPGALMALPVAATIQAFISTYLHRHEVVDSELTKSREHNHRHKAEATSGDDT